MEFTDFVTKAVDDGKSVNTFYSYFAKAFDKVPRKRLVKKMKAKGLELGSSGLDRRLAERQKTKSLYSRRKIGKLHRRFRHPTWDSPRDKHYS